MIFQLISTKNINALKETRSHPLSLLPAFLIPLFTFTQNLFQTSLFCLNQVIQLTVGRFQILKSMEYAISLCTDTIPAAFFPTLYVKRYRLPHRGSTDDLAGIFSDRVPTG